MTKHYLKKLEYNKILELLETYCQTYIGKEKAHNLLPSNNKQIVQKLLNETDEGVRLIYKNSIPPIYDIANVNIYLKKIESSVAISAKALLDIANILKNANELKEYFYSEFINNTEYPILDVYFSKLYSNTGITEKIFKCIIDENTIADTASNNLNNIRRTLRHLEQDIKSKLNSLIHSSRYSKYIQENIVTIRNDRYVIPVKEEYRSMIKGFVHDMSSSGSTVFIEPISVFELNNEINNLKVEENIEIEKILLDLTLMLHPYTNELISDVDIIGNLDFIFSKSKYSIAINGITPIINTEKYINLIDARHPLIDKNLVVPISVSLGNNYSTLVITGPNTGGKTVTLKTVGLLSCMACSGLNIPANEHSSIYVFDNIFADIGDDQSIAESLSTFSSHILNISNIVKEATANSLILVDELGSGTDPLEGANLAISILEHFNNLHCLTIATTHYQELKKYALLTNGFYNASVEFDIENLKPTYKLLVGIPGKSNAFAISQRLGLDENIINRAKEFVNSNEFSFEELLKTIYDDKSNIEKEKDEIHKKLDEINILKHNLEKDNSELKKQEENIINSAKIEARKILLNAKEQASETLKQLNTVTDTSKLHLLQKNLNTSIKNISIESSNNLSKQNDIIKKEDIKPNQNVFITHLNQNGIILSYPNKSNEVQVQIGSMKLNVNVNNISLPKQNHQKKSDVSTLSHSTKKSKNIASEINVIGLTVDEATPIIDKYLDDCVLSSFSTAHIIHGMGTGALRKGIHNYLKNHPHVKSFRVGTFGEGSAGVTIVELK